MWREPLKWNRKAEQAGVLARVFCASLADVFEDWNGVIKDHNGNILTSKRPAGVSAAAMPRTLTMSDLRRDLFALIDSTPWLDWLLLTKRPENILKMWPKRLSDQLFPNSIESYTGWRHNVWLGTSVAHQPDADKNIPELLKCRQLSPVLFVSYEPAIGPVDFKSIPSAGCYKIDSLAGILRGTITRDRRPYASLNWLIVGGESGHDARPFDLEWARSAVDQCGYSRVPVFIKQMGSNPFDSFCRSGLSDQRIHFRDSKGVDIEEWPGNIRVRQFPQFPQVTHD